MVFTFHKPLAYGRLSAYDRYSPSEIRHLEYVSQFVVAIRHVSGADNSAVDALSGIN